MIRHASPSPPVLGPSPSQARGKEGIVMSVCLIVSTNHTAEGGGAVCREQCVVCHVFLPCSDSERESVHANVNYERGAIRK